MAQAFYGTDHGATHELALVLRDGTGVLGKENVIVDIMINGASVGAGEVDYEKFYKEHEDDPPQSLMLLTILMDSLGEYMDEV